MRRLLNMTRYAVMQTDKRPISRRAWLEGYSINQQQASQKAPTQCSLKPKYNPSVSTITVSHRLPVRLVSRVRLSLLPGKHVSNVSSNTTSQG